MKPLLELIQLIERQGKACTPENKAVWRECWILAKRVQELTSPVELEELTHGNPNKVAQLVNSTQVIIDRETARNRMVLLNKLKAAPGQMNRAMVTHFLFTQKWISDRQTCDDWPLHYMPRNDKELLMLSDEIDEFSRRQAKEASA